MLLQGEGQRSFMSTLQGAFQEAQLETWFEDLRTKLTWSQPKRNRQGVQMPRSTAWLTQDRCSCEYAYGGYTGESDLEAGRQSCHSLPEV